MYHSVGLNLNLEMSHLWNDVSISTMIPDVLIDDVNITSAIHSEVQCQELITVGFFHSKSGKLTLMPTISIRCVVCPCFLIYNVIPLLIVIVSQKS